MANPHQFYLSHLYTQAGYRANWLPDKPLKIGDVGKLEDGIFTLYTTMEQQGIPVKVRQGDVVSSLDYSSHDSISVSLQPKADIKIPSSQLSAKTSIKLEFKTEKSILFQSAGSKKYLIENLADIEREALARYKNGTWPLEWVVISEIMEMDNATIIISTSKNNVIEFEADVDLTLPKIQFADAQLGLRVTSEKGSSTKFISQKGLTPLFQAKGIKKGLFQKPKFRSRSFIPASINSLDDLEFDVKEIQ